MKFDRCDHKNPHALNHPATVACRANGTAEKLLDGWVGRLRIIAIVLWIHFLDRPTAVIRARPHLKFGAAEAKLHNWMKKHSLKNDKK